MVTRMEVVQQAPSLHGHLVGNRWMDAEILVSHIAGSTLAGRSQQFAQSRIQIGRHPENDVAFDPESDLTVSGHHAELSLENGDVYLTDLNSRNGTFINEQRLEGRQALADNDTVRLGDDGPIFRVSKIPVSLDQTLEASAAPRKLVGQETLHRVLEDVVQRERHKTRSHVVWAVGLVLVLAVMAGTALWFNQRSSHERLEALNEKVLDTEALVAQIRGETESLVNDRLAAYDKDLQKLEGEVSRSASDFGRVLLQIQERDRLLRELSERHDLSDEQRQVLRNETLTRLDQLSRELEEAEKALRVGSNENWQNVAEGLGPSLFLCVIVTRDSDEPHLGTAFALAKDGVLVTAAPLTKHYDPRNRMNFVVQNQTGKVFQIEGVTQDERYNGTIRSPAIGLLKIKTKGQELPTVKVATRNQLEKLRVGSHLGTLGYPAELASVYLKGINESPEMLKAAVATFKDGWIGRITSFQLETPSFEDSLLVQHSASLTEGAEGSPLFLADGTVVAMHLSVETVTYVSRLEQGQAVVSRSSNPAEIGYAVRIDAVMQTLAKARE